MTFQTGSKIVSARQTHLCGVSRGWQTLRDELQIHPSRRGPISAILSYQLLHRTSTERSYSVHLPDGASVTLSADFDADQLFILLTVVREALR